jgi:hypothetical protein
LEHELREVRNMLRKLFLLFIVIISTVSLVSGPEEELLIQQLKAEGHEPIFGPITIEQAKQIIRDWSGRSNLSIQLEPASCFDSWYEGWRDRDFGQGIQEFTPFYHSGFPLVCYMFKVEDPNPDHKYSGIVAVDSWRGEVARFIQQWIMPPEDEVDLAGNISEMLSPAEALQLAKQYMASYFPNVNINDFRCIDLGVETTPDGSSWTRHSYIMNVLFDMDGEIEGPSGPISTNVPRALVSFLSHTGELISIWHDYQPLQISLVPQITKEEAIEIASSFLYGLGAQYMERPLGEPEWWFGYQVPDGRQRLAIGIGFCYVSPREDASPQAKALFSGYEGLVDVFVDGHTGEVFWVYRTDAPPIHSAVFHPKKRYPTTCVFLNGKEKKLKEQPIVKGGKVFLALEDVKSLGFGIERKGEEYFLIYKNQRVAIKEGFFTNKGNKKYLDSKALEKIKGIKTEYSSKFNSLLILTINKKGYEQAISVIKKARNKTSKAGIIAGASLLLLLPLLVVKLSKFLS